MHITLKWTLFLQMLRKTQFLSGLSSAAAKLFRKSGWYASGCTPAPTSSKSTKEKKIDFIYFKEEKSGPTQKFSYGI